MRANPYEHTGIDPSELTYAGDNFVRYGGETQTLAKKQLFGAPAPPPPPSLSSGGQARLTQTGNGAQRGTRRSAAWAFTCRRTRR